jgi:hypothetical protein
MGALTAPSPADLTEGFKWRDGSGQMHAPGGMETRHLFYTLRMIWNNTMPATARLPGNLYRFPPHYTTAYMRDAIKALSQELVTRQDMTEEYTTQLQHMLDWLATPQLGPGERPTLK